MRIFLTGASGLVGSAFAQAAARRGHQVEGIVGRFAGSLVGVARQRAIDLSSENAVMEAVLESFPDCIVNCAAISEPAACDADPAGSEVMNVVLPSTLAKLAHHLSARLVHISSEQAFDGRQTSAYDPSDAVSPINRYGRQKVASEAAVCSAAAKFSAIVRAPLLMGDSPGGRRGLHERLLADWAAGRTAKLYIDEFRQPCTAENLAEVLLELAERKDLTGVFHWAGSELVSRYDLGLRVRAHFKLSEESAPIAAVTRADTPDAAKQRQPCLALNISALAGRLKTRPQTIAEQLAGLKIPAPVREWYFAHGS
jgi:dTDP-4-dehydrorhamnose reductase